LALRPFRLWEYTWLYKSLRLSEGGMKILDLGGSASHLPILAALAGCKVTTLDINAAFVQAAQEVAHGLNLRSFDACVGDMRDLSGFPEDSFDTVLCCSVLEHLTAHDQELTLMQMARVLKPGGAIGLTFDYGTPAPGANEHLPPPHEPPLTAAEVLRRYLQGPLLLAGNAFTEDPIPGALFHDEHIRYTVASLFLTKSPAFPIDVPKCEPAGTVLGGLVIQDLPSRVYKTVTRAQQAAYELEQSLEEERQHAAVLEAIASERLIAMQEKEDLIMRLNGELRKLGERRLFQRVFPRLFWRDRIRK